MSYLLVAAMERNTPQAKEDTMSDEKKSCGENKLCALTCGPCDLDLEGIKPLVNDPKFICKACG